MRAGLFEEPEKNLSGLARFNFLIIYFKMSVWDEQRRNEFPLVNLSQTFV